MYLVTANADCIESIANRTGLGNQTALSAETED